MENHSIEESKKDFYEALIDFKTASIKRKKNIKEKLESTKVNYDLNFVKLKKKEKKENEK